MQLACVSFSNSNSLFYENQTRPDQSLVMRAWEIFKVSISAEAHTR